MLCAHRQAPAQQLTATTYCHQGGRQRTCNAAGDEPQAFPMLLHHVWTVSCTPEVQQHLKYMQQRQTDSIELAKGYLMG